MYKGALAFACVVLAANPIGATNKLDPPELERYLRWGPLRVRPGLALSNLGYDDNILLGSDQRQVSDYTATVTPRVDGLVLFGHTAFLTLLQQFDFTAYASNTDQNFWNSRSRGRLTVPFGSFGLFTDAEYNRVRERPVDLDDIRPRRREVGGTVGVIWEAGWRTEIELGRRVRDYDYEDPDFDPNRGQLSISDRLDRTSGGTSLRVGYRALGRTRLLFDSRFERIEFDQPVTIGSESIPRDTRETRLLAGLEFLEGGALTGSFVVGWGSIDAEDPSLADLSEVIGEAEMVYRLNSRTKFELEAKRLPGFAVTGANSYYLDTKVGLRGVYFFSRLIGVEAGSSRGRLTFPGAVGALRRTDDLSRDQLGIRLRLMQNSIGRRVEYSVRIGRYRRDSTVAGADRSQTTIGIGAVLGF